MLLGFLNACTSVQDGLTLQKKNRSDEFLVKKKNPLVLPPNYNELPLPKEDSTLQTPVSSSDIQELLGKNKNNINKQKIENTSNKIEQNILNKIKSK